MADNFTPGDQGAPDNASADGATTETASTKSAHEFPHKMRVHALARILGMTSREALGYLADVGVSVRSPQSSIDRSAAVAVQNHVANTVEANADSATEQQTVDSSVSAPVDTSEATDVAAQDANPSTLFSSLSDASATTSALVRDDVEPDSGGQSPLFLPPPPAEEVRRTRRRTARAVADVDSTADAAATEPTTGAAVAAIDESSSDQDGDGENGSGSRRRRRGRRGRGRGRGESDASLSAADGVSTQASDDSTGTASDVATDDAQTGRDQSGGDRGQSEHARVDGATGDQGKPGKKSGKKKKASRKTSQAEAGVDANAAASEDVTADSDSSSVEASDTRETNSPDNDADEKSNSDSSGKNETGSDESDGSDATESGSGDESGSKRRRRRRRRKSGDAAGNDDAADDDPPNTVVHEREPRNKSRRDEVQGISGSTRLEAKRQRRRDGRDAVRRRPPILTESEFLARRESVNRVMVVRERAANSSLSEGERGITEDYTQVAVLEDNVLVEHFVTTSTSSSMVGNIYLGRVQNVLPGMEAAFVDIGRGRNGVLYAGEVNWDAAGLDGGSRKIEQALKPGDKVVVQVSKDPVGHKGARLTTQISLAGRYLVYVPDGSSTGISRKLPDVERKRLKNILSKLVPADAGVIIRTASEGVSADELSADIDRLKQQWDQISAAAGISDGDRSSSKGVAAPTALYEEPDLLVKVVRDLFNEDFSSLIVDGVSAWDHVHGYVKTVAPDLLDRVSKFDKPHADSPDAFAAYRIDEQLAKALDRKVWLPSGGTLIIEHTEAMTVVDVNTGKFTGSGGNLEETVTRNNLEAAEEIVRQMRLRDIGGMIIVDFIDMVLESNRDLVLRRVTEALSRDRTRHQVSEVTSLGLVQMTRKRLGTGLLEAFSSTCTCCGGRGIVVHANPVEIASADDGVKSDGGKRSRRARAKKPDDSAKSVSHSPGEHPMFRAMAGSDESTDALSNDVPDQTQPSTTEVASGGDELNIDEATGAASDATGGGQGNRSSRRRRSRRTADSHADAAESSATAEAPTAEAQTVEAPTAKAQAADAPTVSSAVTSSSVGSAEVANSGDATEQSPTSTARVEPSSTTAEKPDVAVTETRVRRRAVRRPASAPTTSGAAVSGTVDSLATTQTHQPVTTVVAQPTVQEPVAAPRSRPRRRAAGRPAGPPVDES